VAEGASGAGEAGGTAFRSRFVQHDCSKTCQVMDRINRIYRINGIKTKTLSPSAFRFST
jgi:hypothetical protein